MRESLSLWVDRPAPPTTTADAQLVVEIRAALVRGRGAYGSPRVHRELRAHGMGTTGTAPFPICATTG
jgi:hypothetical protein